MSRLLTLLALLCCVGEALAVPVQLPGIVVTDDVADPFDYGDSRGILLGVRYTDEVGVPTIAASAEGIVDPVVAALLPDRRLYVLDRSSDPLGVGRPTGGVYIVDPNARPADSRGTLVLASPLFRRPSDLRLDGDLRILVLDSEADPLGTGDANGALFRGDPVTNNFEVLAADPRFREPVCLTDDLDGTFLVLDRFANPQGLGDGSPGALFRVDPATGEVGLVKAFDPVQLPDPRAVTVLPDGDYLIADAVADPGGQSDGHGAIFHLSRSTGEVTTFIDDPLFRDPLDILVGEETDLWVLDRNSDPDGSAASVGALFRFDLPTRERLLAQTTTLLKGPVSIAFAGGPSLDESTVDWIDETGGALEPGNFVTVRATLRSVGTEDANEIVYVDTLGGDWTFVAGSDSIGTGGFQFDGAGSILEWTGSLPRGVTETIRYRLRVSGDLVEGSEIVDQVRLKVGAGVKTFSFEGEIAEPFAPGVVVFVDQRVDDGNRVGLIRAVDPNSLTPQTIHFGAPLVQPADAAFLEEGLLAVLDVAAGSEEAGTEVVLLYDRATGDFETLWVRAPDDGIVAPTGLTVDLDGNILLVDRNANPFDLPYDPGPGDFGPGAIFRIDRDTGQITPLYSDARMREPFDAEVAADGTVVVVDYTGTNGNGDLWEFDPETGEALRRFLNDSWFRDPIGLALDPATGAAYVTDITHYNDENENPIVDNGTILRVGRGNPTTYAILSQSSRLVDPAGCFLSEDGMLYITDRDANPSFLDVTDTGAVFRLDLGTGVITTVAADFGLRRPGGPTGLGLARIEVGDLTLVDQNGSPVSPGDTLAFSIKLRNDTRQSIRETLTELEFSEDLELDTVEAGFGEVLLASSRDRFSWVGTIGAGDTLQISGEVRVRSGSGYGTLLTARAVMSGRGQLEERTVERRLAAPFSSGAIFVADESADPEGQGGSPGTVFGLSREQDPVSVLLSGFPLRDPSAMIFRENGTLLIADRMGGDPGEVFELDPNADTIRSIFQDNSQFVTPVDLLYTPGGDLLIVDRDADQNGTGAGKGTIFRLPEGSDTPVVFSAAPEFRFLSEATYLGDRLFVTDRQADPDGVGGNSAAIFELDLGTGQVLESWQFAEIREPTGLAVYGDLLLVTDLIANPRGFQTAPGALFTLDPDSGEFLEFMVNSRTRRPYRSYPQVTGSVLVVDQEAAGTGQNGSPGVIFEYDPESRLLREFALSDDFAALSEIAQLPASAVRFLTYEVTDLDGAPLRSADRVGIGAELSNDGSIGAIAEFEDPLPDGVSLVPGTLQATTGTATLEGGNVHWSGNLEPGEQVSITYETQLDPVRVRDRVLVFEPVARGPIVGELSQSVRLAVYVNLDPGHFYVLDADADPLGTTRRPGAVLKAAQRSGTVASWFSDPNWRNPVDLAVVGDTDPRVFVLDEAAVAPGTRRGVLFEVDVEDLSTRVAAVDSTWFRVESILPISETELLLVDSWADPFEQDIQVGPGALYLLNPVSGQTLVVASDTSWVRPIDVALTKTGRWLLLDADADPLETGSPRGAIFSIDIISGESELFAASASWEQPVAITVAPDSTIYVVDQAATPSGSGTGSVWSLADVAGAEPELFAVSDEFVTPSDLVAQIDGDLVLVDEDASPGLQAAGRGAIFLSQGQSFVALAATSAMTEPRAIVIYGDVTPIVDLGLYAIAVDEGVEVGWRGISERSDTRYLVYRRVVEGPEVLGDPDLAEFELVPTERDFRGGGNHALVDGSVEPDTWYAYAVALVSPDGRLDTSVAVPVRTRATVLTFALSPATPNPFGAEATLQFQIPRAGRVDLDIFDVGGRRVRQLVSADLEPGSYQVGWDGRSDASYRLASGVYFARLAWEGDVLTRRIVRIR